ncbi:hypothetical protein ACFO3U_11970 [Flavobacterium ponti]|uniref:Lipocalin-like domain-containing protein n=1 Tax=Flavobacterium ponti TaxID=665133 RepID=A0ABV9P714_9FLAO
MKSNFLIFLILPFMLSCKNQICGTYEILDSTKFEKEILQEKLDSLKYLRKNKGKYILTLRCDSVFYLKDINSDNSVNNFKGRWNYNKNKISLIYVQNNNHIKKDFFINKNTLLNIQKVKLCENDEYINNITFLTKTKNPD